MAKRSASAPKRKRKTDSTVKRWSAKVMQTSDALDREEGIFKRPTQRKGRGQFSEALRGGEQAS